MKAISVFSIAAAAGLLTLVLGTPTVIAEPLVYVPLGGDGKIVVVDAARDQVVDTIANLTAVHGLAGTPDGQFLIAGSYQEREVNGSIPDQPSGITEDEHAAHHGAAPTGGTTASSVVSIVSVVRIADGSIVRRIDVPGAVHHVTVSPDGRYAVVTHPNEGAISAIDLGSYKVVANLQTGPFTNYAAFGLEGKTVYVSNAGDGTISAVDSERWTVEWTATVGASPEHVVLSEDGNFLYVNNVDEGSVSVIEIEARRVIRTIPIGSTLHGIDLSDDGRTLFVADLGDDKVVAFDLATDTYRSARLAPAPYHLAAVRGAGKLYVSSADEPKIWVLDPESFAVLSEIKIGGKGHQMVLVPGT